jgi:YebC/PmpR family DNA-binding regulatory protein
MSGHSKWSTIKRKKGVVDAKRGKIFTRLTRELVMSAREGGGDPNSNFRLRLAIDKARSANMPKDNIERAIKRGAGDDKDGNAYEEITYEGYAPHGIALVIECVTDKKQRTVSEVRHALSKGGGNLGSDGSVAWQFTRQAYFVLKNDATDFNSLFEIAVESGADDVSDDGESYEITAELTSFKEVSDALDAAGIKPEEAGLRMVPEHETELDKDATVKVMRVIESLEDLDDVQNVYSNLFISDDALAEMA